MSAPDTNVDKQEKQHKPSLLGIKGVLIFAFTLLVLFVGYVFLQGDNPEGAAVQVEPGVGTEAAD